MTLEPCRLVPACPKPPQPLPTALAPSSRQAPSRASSSSASTLLIDEAFARRAIPVHASPSQRSMATMPACRQLPPNRSGPDADVLQSAPGPGGDSAAHEPWRSLALGRHRSSPAQPAAPDLRERYSDQPALISTLRSGLIASGFFGSVTVSTPLLKLAPILSASTPDGSENERWKAP